MVVCMKTKLLIIGTGGQAKECAQLARQIDPQCQRWSTIEYVTNNKHLLGVDLPFGRIEVLDADLQHSSAEVDVVVGIGHPEIKKDVCLRFSLNLYLSFPNLIHSDVSVDHNFVKMGLGNIVTKGVVMTCDIRIGNFNLFNFNSTIGHDTEIGNYNVFNPGSSVSGCVKIGDTCLIGTGARIIEKLQIKSNIVIGAGAVVTKSIDDPGTYVGVPAKLKENS
jgi:sugar O-acyltransferase (sialic acid O-acetyltransferase NeuD family)